MYIKLFTNTVYICVGIGMRPLPQYDTTLIRFQQGKPSSYKPYTDHLQAFLLRMYHQLRAVASISNTSLFSLYTQGNMK